MGEMEDIFGKEKSVPRDKIQQKNNSLWVRERRNEKSKS